MKKYCVDCEHECHCVGSGFYVQDQNCYADGCVCVDCNHNVKIDLYNNALINEEETMAKKIIKWVWKIVCWPWKKLVDWLWTR